jgi:2-polyprenyl-3-methyl-5-hydroxy-6-metoxy-1,4-benzoquinol methylase
MENKMNTDDRYEKCPVCVSSDIVMDFFTVEHQAMGDSLEAEYNLSCCKKCGFVFQNPIFHQVADISHYEHESRYTIQETKGHAIAKTDQLDWIEAVLNENGIIASESTERPSIYEIGASVGAFLIKAQSRGWQVSGLEPSQSAIDTAYENHAIAIDKGFLKDCKTIEADVVSMFHVFEHIIDPVDSLEYLFKITSDDCTLCIEVPNIARPKNCLGGLYWHPEHVSYFSPENLIIAGSRTGWSCISLGSHEYDPLASDYCAYPVLRVVFVKRSLSYTQRIKQQSLDFIEDQKQSEQQRILHLIRHFLSDETAGDVVLFGAGGHTDMLYACMDDFCKAKVTGITDSNPAVTGSVVSGHKVAFSSNLKQYSDPKFIVSSQGYQDQIVDFIKQQLGDDVNILTFYV